jgi:hypothetical protein
MLEMVAGKRKIVNPDTVDPLDTLEGKNLIYNKIQPVKKRVKRGSNRSTGQECQEGQEGQPSLLYTHTEKRPSFWVKTFNNLWSAWNGRCLQTGSDQIWRWNKWPKQRKKTSIL